MKPLRILTAILSLTLCSHALAELQDIDKELSDLAEKLAVPIKEHAKTKIAVLDFTDLQGSSEGELGKYIAEQLTVNFVTQKRDFSLLDRANLRKILAEHKLTSQGLVDPENAKKLGMFAGVDALILGTIIPKSANIMSLTAKIITTDTAEIIGAARAEFKADDTVRQLVSKPAVDSKGDEKQEKQDEKSEVAKSFGDLRVELQPLQVVNGQQFLLRMTLINQNSKKSIWVALHDDRGTLKSRITDSDGTEFVSYGGNTATGIEIASYYKDPYQPQDFSPSTEIRPSDSISATVKFFTIDRKRPTAGACNVQLQFLLGHDLGGNRATITIHNMTSKLSAN